MPSSDHPVSNALDRALAADYERAAAFLAAIVESSSDAIVGKTIDGIIQSWNAGARRLYGYSSRDAVGKSMAMLLPPDRCAEENGILHRIRNGQRIENFETVRIRRDGQPVRVSLTISPIRNSEGVIIGASHIARDIGERMQLEQTAARLAAIVESSDDAIVSKDLEGIILTWNSGAERIYGYTAGEAVGRAISILLPPDRIAEETGILERLRRGERVEHFETVRVRKDGTRIEVSLTISPIRERNGAVVGASHVARDITARKTLEAQMHQTQKLESLGVLAGGVAHDFNNLLTGMMANASLAAQAPSIDPDARMLLDDVVRAAERASNLTRQLLAYAGRGRVTSELIDLSALVEDIGSLIRTSIPAKVRLRYNLARPLPPIEGDPGQMQQVVMNLVINAAEAIGDANGTVLVTTGVETVDEYYGLTSIGRPDLPPGEYTSLEIQDDGCGMTDETLLRIFDPFFTTKQGGRGLGLAAVLGIVNSHKAALKVHSVPGKGTTFKLLFPSSRQHRPEQTRPRQPADALPGRGTVLVVDDEETVRNAAKNALTFFGYTVLLAQNGRDGVEMARARNGIDLVLLDFTMPDMNGPEALESLQNVNPGLPVLLSSGLGEDDVLGRFAGRRVAGFIQKPYTAAQLILAVKGALKQAGTIVP